MAVQIGHARNSDPMALIAGLRRRVDLDADEPALVGHHPDVADPALRQQRFLKEQSSHVLLPGHRAKLWTASDRYNMYRQINGIAKRPLKTGTLRKQTSLQETGRSRDDPRRPHLAPVPSCDAFALAPGPRPD